MAKQQFFFFLHLCTKYQHNCTCIQTHLIHTFCCKITAGWFCSLHSHLSLVTSQRRVKVRINQYSNFSFSTQISHLWATHVHTHTHTHMGTRTYEYSDHTQLNLHSLKRAANRYLMDRQQHGTENMAGLQFWEKKYFWVTFEWVQRGFLSERTGKVDGQKT